MAGITQSGNITYAGIDAGRLIGKELVKASSLAAGIFTIREHVKGVGVLRVFDFGEGDLQSGAACGFSAAGGEINNKKVTLVPLKANVEACKADFNADFTANDMEAGASGMLSSEAVEVITSSILSAVAIRVEKDIWAGMKTEAAADSDTVKITLADPLTVANILDETGKVYAALASVPEFDANTAFIVMSNQDKAKYEQALAKAGAMPAFYLGEKGTNFLGVRIVASVGMVEGDIFGSMVSNMFYMTDLDNDRNSVAVKDMDESDLSGNIRFKALWTAAASYAHPKNFVIGTK